MSKILTDLYHGQLNPERFIDRSKQNVYSELISEIREKVVEELPRKTKNDLEQMESMMLSECAIAEELAFAEGFKCAIKLMFNSMF